MRIFRLHAEGQSVIEYLVIFAVVAILSVIFVANDKIPQLFTGYVTKAKTTLNYNGPD